MTDPQPEPQPCETEAVPTPEPTANNDNVLVREPSRSNARTREQILNNSTPNHADLILSYSSSISYDESETRNSGEYNASDIDLDEVLVTIASHIDVIKTFCSTVNSLDSDKREAFFYDKNLANKLDYIRSKTFSSFLNCEERVVIVVDLIVNSDLPALYFKFLEYINFNEEVVANSRCRKVTNFIKIQTIIWNISDKSTELCSRLLQDGLAQRLFPLLFGISRSQNCLDITNVRLVTKGIIGVLYNVVQKVPSARGLFRLQQGVRILRLFVDQDHVAIKTGCLLLLSHIVDEFENDFINATDDNICYVLNIFSECGKSFNRHSKEFGYHGLEMLQGLKAIASQDRNKEKLVRNNVLTHLEAYITNHQNDWSQDEELAVYELLWSLAYDDICRKEINNRKVLMKMMTDASENGRSVLIRRSASGALWKVHDVFGKRQRKRSYLSSTTLISPLRGSSELLGEVAKEEDEVLYEDQMKSDVDDNEALAAAFDDELDDDDDDDDVVDSAVDGDGMQLECQIKREHIFISYSHTTQKMMLKVRDLLREDGYNVWMDVDYMVGSTIESMATAVEGAAIVIFGMCQRFKDSPHCRAELEYAYRLQKPMLPLVMEADFKADGWLGFLCGSKLTYDLIEEDDLEKNFSSILKELGGRGKPSCADGNCTAKVFGLSNCSAPMLSNESGANTMSSCKASCRKEASTDNCKEFQTKVVEFSDMMDGLASSDATGIWMRQESSNHNPAPLPTKGEVSRDSIPDLPMSGCLGCGRFRTFMSRSSTGSHRFGEWTGEQVATWLDDIGLRECCSRLSGLDGELLMEWQRMRCVAPEFFYRTAKEELDLGLMNILRLTQGMAKLCEESTSSVE